MVQRRLARMSLIIAAAIPLLLAVSYYYPIQWRADRDGLPPAYYVGLRQGGFEYSSFTSLAQYPGRSSAGSARAGVYYWRSDYAHGAIISGAWVLWSDRRACLGGGPSLYATLPVAVVNPRQTKVELFPSLFLMLSGLLLLHPAVYFAVRRYRSSRWRRAGCCAGCGYDLTGNTSGVCPECGGRANVRK